MGRSFNPGTRSLNFIWDLDFFFQYNELNTNHKKWFLLEFLLKIGKGVRQDCILSPCLFNLYAEYIMRNAGLDEAQAGIKIAGRNINNLRYADDTTTQMS